MVEKSAWTGLVQAGARSGSGQAQAQMLDRDAVPVSLEQQPEALGHDDAAVPTGTGSAKPVDRDNHRETHDGGRDPIRQILTNVCDKRWLGKSAQ